MNLLSGSTSTKNVRLGWGLKNELVESLNKSKKRTGIFDVSALLQKMENELSVESLAASHSFFLLCL